MSQPKIALRACPICGMNDVHVLHTQSFVLAESCPLPRSYDIVVCGNCGFVYADTPGGQPQYDRYYELFSKYEDPNIATGGGDSHLDYRRLDDTAATLDDLVPIGRDRARILDMGCAGGGLLQALRRKGFIDLTGIDPSPACVARVRGDGLKAIQGRVSDLSHLKGLGSPYDAIVLSHVLEHVVDVLGAMKALRGLLVDEGILYIEVPDAARYVEYPFVPFYYFDAEHINHFDTASLANLASATQFRMMTSGQKELAVGDGQLYPAVWAALTPVQARGALTLAVELHERMVAYIKHSLARGTNVDLERLALEQCPIALWGAGSHSQRLLKHSVLGQCRIVAVVDRDRVKQGQKFAGLEIQAPEAGLAHLAPEAVVVIASVLHANAITREVRALGIANNILVA